MEQIEDTSLNVARNLLTQRKRKCRSDYKKKEEEQLEKLLFGGATAFVENLEKSEITTTNIITPPKEGEISNESNERKPAWFDEDDLIAVGDALDCQNRKLPRGGINSRDNKYSDLLRHKFEQIVGTPAWASLDKREHESDSDDDVLQSCGFIKKSSKVHLPSRTLEIKKLRNLNQETQNEGPLIKCVEFHPSSSVALVAGVSGVASLFSVDGKANNKLHNVAFENYPIMCTKFFKDGNEAILGSCRKHMFSYDLLAAKAVRIALPDEVTQMSNFIISPDGKLLAVAGRWGQVHMLSSFSKERLYMLKQEGDVTSLAFSPSGNYLYGHSELGEVTIWDLTARRVKHKWFDDGCLKGTAIDVSQSNQFLATGSAEGAVNIYDLDKILDNQCPKPRKSFLNLTTSIHGLKFNPTSEMLSFFSRELENSVRLVHLETNTVFQNFPLFNSKMGKIEVVNYSPGSGYFALGNTKSRVSLFRLKHYKSY